MCPELSLVDCCIVNVIFCWANKPERQMKCFKVTILYFCTFLCIVYVFEGFTNEPKADFIIVRLLSLG